MTASGENKWSDLWAFCDTSFLFSVSKTVTFLLSENNIKFSTIPANITEELAQYLNIDSGNNYIYLAGKMKYDSTFTNNLKLLPREATQELLKDWQMRDDATVYKLYCYLEELERHDCMAILRPLLISQGSDVAMVWASVAFSPTLSFEMKAPVAGPLQVGNSSTCSNDFLFFRFICSKESPVEH